MNAQCCGALSARSPTCIEIRVLIVGETAKCNDASPKHFSALRAYLDGTESRFNQDLLRHPFFELALKRTR